MQKIQYGILAESKNWVRNFYAKLPGMENRAIAESAEMWYFVCGIFHAEGVRELRDMEKKRKTDAEFHRRCFHYTVRIADESGIPGALRDYCGKKQIPFNAFIAESVAEKLERMDVHSLSIAEIEAIERGDVREG